MYGAYIPFTNPAVTFPGEFLPTLLRALEEPGEFTYTFTRAGAQPVRVMRNAAGHAVFRIHEGELQVFIASTALDPMVTKPVAVKGILSA